MLDAHRQFGRQPIEQGALADRGQQAEDGIVVGRGAMGSGAGDGPDTQPLAALQQLLFPGRACWSGPDDLQPQPIAERIAQRLGQASVSDEDVQAVGVSAQKIDEYWRAGGVSPPRRLSRGTNVPRSPIALQLNGAQDLTQATIAGLLGDQRHAMLPA